LKKDMMMNREDISYWNQRPPLKNTTDKVADNCVLTPTDHSAATLAIAHSAKVTLANIATTTPSLPLSRPRPVSPSPSPPSRQSGLRSISLTPKFPMISWMRADNTKNKPGSGGYTSSDADDNNTFGNLEQDHLDWDPDDTSVGYAASDTSVSDVFTPTTGGSSNTENNHRNDKSSLLSHHPSFQRNESYKLQRLRTPTGGALGPSRGSRPVIPTTPTMRTSHGESIEVKRRPPGSSELVMV
jgi:hypothetical protein